MPCFYMIWFGSKPEQCNLCHTEIQKGFVDGKTEEGRWAIMCPFCSLVHGVGLGVGKGQLYVRADENADFVKIKG